MMKRLPMMDSSWLMMESRETPMHVAGLQLYDLPEDAGDDYLQNFYQWMIDVPAVAPPFNQKLKTRMGQMFWVDDTHFDIEYHVRHLALPRPGRIRELLSLTSRLHGRLMDRNRPLWESHLIEGIEGNRFAVYTKLHHSMVDGVAGMKLMQARMSTSAEAEDPPPWSKEWLHREKGKAKPKRAAPTAESTTGNDSLLAGLGQTASEFLKIYRNPEASAAVLPYQAPKSILNVRVTGARRFAAQSWSLSRLKAVGQKHGATLNDVVLAMCGGCMRQYLQEYNALPDKTLVANVPVSIRPADAEASGNAITVIQANLGTNIGDPIERLEVVKNSMQKGKELIGRMTRTEVITYTTLVNMPFSLGQVVPLGGRLPPMFNIVVSNVPGPKEDLYLNGARLNSNYPVSLVFHGYALNITLTSYKDNIDVGIIAARETLPKIQRLLDYLEASLVELEDTNKPKAPRRKRVKAAKPSA